jgi:hypothetical protein
MKHVKLFESFVSSLNEAARLGSSNWKTVMKDLEDMRWELDGEEAVKYYNTDDDDERELRISADGGEVSYKVLDGDGNELESGSFDGEGLSAGELDSEVWGYLEENGNQ